LECGGFSDTEINLDVLINKSRCQENIDAMPCRSVPDWPLIAKPSPDTRSLAVRLPGMRIKLTFPITPEKSTILITATR
jgi:hypothetical protein